jgi:hypothetical protein
MASLSAMKSIGSMQNIQTNTFSILADSLVTFTGGYFFAKNLEQEKITQLINQKNAIIAGLSSTAKENDDELLKPPSKNKPVSNSDSITKPQKLNFGIIIGNGKGW